MEIVKKMLYFTRYLAIMLNLKKPEGTGFYILIKKIK